MEEHFNSETDIVKYLWEDDSVIGFYRYSRWPREENQTDTAHLFDIAVLPERQQQGNGTLLIKDLIDDCRNRQYKRILSRTFKNNEASIRLHQSTGFSVFTETEDSLIWEKNL